MSEFKRSLTRFLMGIPRAIAPVVTVGSRTFVFRDADVREIIRRDEDFLLGPVNGENISRHIGPFILGMDDGPKYQHDKAILRSSVHREDPKRIRNYIREEAARIVAELPDQFDVVSCFTRLIPLKMVGDYFGTPGPEKEKMWHWNRSLFWDVFMDLSHDPTIRATAEQSAKEMNAYLDQLIQDRKAVLNAGGKLPDDMISRLIAQQTGNGPSFTDAEIRGNIAGTFLGALEPTNKAVVNILNQFFNRPEVLKLARIAAQNDDADAMQKLAWEAMRFHPNAPTLMRCTQKEQTIGGTDRKARRIKAGKTVFAMISSAMFDSRAMPSPKEFDPERPKETYLYFGMGLHTCFGNYVNYVSIPEMLIALLKVEGLCPAPGKAGKIVFDGPFPDKWEFVKG